MGSHTSRITRSGDLTVAAVFNWAVSAGTGTNPVNAADFPGGTFPSGTATVPANATYVDVTFTSNPDTTVETDETGLFTVTTSQSGVTIAASPQTFTITNDDAAAPSNIYGPTTTDDTGATRINAGPSVAPNGYKISGTLKQAYALHVMGFTDNGATGVGGYVLRGNANGNPSPTSVTGYYRDAAGTESLDNNVISLSTPNVSAGVTFECEVSKTGTVKLTIGGTVVLSRSVYGAQTDLSLFSFLRVMTNSATTPITVTAL